jgi:hypothetical protein
MAAPSLKLLAAEMRRRVGEYGSQSLRLSHGLEIVLSRKGEQVTLILRRTDVYPSATEQMMCRSAFGAPDEVGITRFQVRMPMKKTHESALYRGFEITWREIPPRSEGLSAGAIIQPGTPQSSR